MGHIEGGEISEILMSILALNIKTFSYSLVSNNLAKKRLSKMGEIKSKIFTCGSPDIDVMLSNNLPSIKIAKIDIILNLMII